MPPTRWPVLFLASDHEDLVPHRSYSSRLLDPDETRELIAQGVTLCKTFDEHLLPKVQVALDLSDRVMSLAVKPSTREQTVTKADQVLWVNSCHGVLKFHLFHF